MTTIHAGLRYPIAFACGTGLTASLFWTLWQFTNQTFHYDVVEPVRIEFTRLQREETLDKKDRTPKAVREEPPKQIELPPIGGARDRDFRGTSVMPRNDPPVVPFESLPVAGSDRDLMPLVRIEPTYPPRALQQGLEGWVQVQFNVSTTGAVTNVTVVESEPGSIFDAAAVNAVSRWRYSPSVVQGAATERVGMQTLIRFNLADE